MARVAAQFSPRDVFLGQRDVAGVSARNHLRGRVCRLAPNHQAVFVAIDIGQIIRGETPPRSRQRAESAT